MAFIILLLFIGLISLTSTTPVGLQVLFPELHRKYTYVVKANISSNTLTPIESGSYWTLEGKLHLQVVGNFTTLRLQLDELKTSVYSKNIGYSSYHSVEAANQLKKPWEVDYQDNGLISYMYIGEESVWTTNIKRAISINFQIRRESGSYTSEEPCLHADCVVVYICKGNVIKKYNNLYRSSIMTERSWSSVPLVWNVDYEIHEMSDIMATAERVYELDEKKGLKSLELSGNYQYKTHDHILSVTSDLSLYYDTDTLADDVDKLNVSRTTLQYVAHDYNDPSNSIRVKTQHELKNITYEILLKIAKKGIDTDNIVRNASLIHSMDFVDLLNTMSQLNYSSLKKLFDDIVLGTSYDLETSRNIFLEVLPHVRTNACALFIKHLVTEEKEKIEDVTLLALIRKLPFNIANHSQELLEELEVFSKLSLDFARDIRHAGILSFATLIYKAKEAWSVKQDYFDNIVVKYFRMYSDCPQYLDRLVWLQGLCNMGYSAESYIKTVYSDNSRERHERLWAAMAGNGGARPHVIVETTIPILMDDSEHIQLRIAALHMFLSTDIRATDFMYVHNYIKNSNNNQLKRFWYTTVKSLESCKVYNGYRTASYYAPFISNQVASPDSTYWATNNYIISTQDLVGEASFQVMSVGEALSALPAFAAVKISTGSKRPYRVAMYVIAEGVTTNMFKKLHTLNAEEMNVDRLVEILRKMKVQIVKPEKVHIDLVIKIQDKTVYAYHINQSRFDSWNGEDLTKSVEDFLRFGSHINQQIVYYPFQLDVNIPTELGTPIRLQSTMVSFTSIRGNLTAPSTQDLTWRNDLHIRFQGISVTSLSTDGPLLKSEHTARIQQSVVAHLPVKFDVTLFPVARSIELKWPNPGAQHGGIAMHSRAQIEMESPKGKDEYTVIRKEERYRTDPNSIFFDCERPLTVTELAEKLLTSKTSSNEFLSSLQPSLIILNSILLLASPTSGTCGIIIPPRRLMHAGNNVLELQLQLQILNLDLDDGVQGKLAHTLIFRENRQNGAVFLNVTGYTKVDSSGGNLTLELLIIAHQPLAVDPLKKKWKICIQEQDISHAALDQDITMHPASYEGLLTLIYAAGDSNPTCLGSGSHLLIQYKGIPTDVYGNLERYFEVKMAGKKLSTLGVLADASYGSQTALGQLLTNFYQQPVNLTAVIREKNGVASVNINNGADLQFKSENFAWLLDSWSNMQIMKKFGIYRECRLQESTVQTLSGALDRLPPVQCSENLALADCSDTPRFAVLRQKRGGIKVYTGGNFVSVVGSGKGAIVTINGDHLCKDDCVFPPDAPIYDLKISRKGDAIKIHSRLSGVQIYHGRTETVLLVPHSYMSTGCGACASQHYYNLCST